MDLALKVEFGFRAFLLNQGHGKPDTSYVSLDFHTRQGRSRSFIVHRLNCNNPFRPQGPFGIQIQHIWDAVSPGDSTGSWANALGLSNMVDETVKCFFSQSDGQSPLPVVADAITAAGRDLAQIGTYGNDPNAATLADQFEDMANFRVDWIAAEETLRLRGETETHHGIFWAEMINLRGFASYASV